MEIAARIKDDYTLTNIINLYSEALDKMEEVRTPEEFLRVDNDLKKLCFAIAFGDIDMHSQRSETVTRFYDIMARMSEVAIRKGDEILTRNSVPQHQINKILDGRLLAKRA